MNHATANFGVLLPTREAIMSGRADPSGLYRIAERAEALGFHSVWVGDSLTARPRIDALTTLAAVGARTSRVRLGTAIFLAALRNPIMLAYQLASLDWMTGGRVDLGVGYGRPKEPAAEHEFHILGLDPSARMKMSEELVQIMRQLWRETDVAYDGKFTRFEHVTIEPKPVQPGGVPIWLASNNVEPGLKRVGRLADAWINNIKDPQTFGECWQKIQNYAAAAGRDPNKIHPSIYFTLAAGGQEAVVEGQQFLAEYYKRPYEAVANAMLCVTGSWDQVIDRTEKYIEEGARTVVLRFAARDQLRALEACAEALKRRKLLD
ncbi:MAG: LLM class flavin-dependent oxidoreductase [Deltaproteobacteria bacterium]|nr:LLM class flavin-dependent oxidoreductase [Deltaproteobacteria bacterium]MBM4296659.1 LLM class flavin-dependent oxidoreductase [Deltaproteobacteria bacterium]